MKTLGIDYGQRKIGLAISDGALAEPFRVLIVGSIEEALSKVVDLVKLEQIKRVVIGISEGTMAEESKKFSHLIGNRISVRVETFDETLTSQDAQRLSREAGVSQKKRRGMEDAYAATIMLQNYLDSSG